MTFMLSRSKKLFIGKRKKKISNIVIGILLIVN
jgi:hypothetical protein